MTGDGDQPGASARPPPGSEWELARPPADDVPPSGGWSLRWALSELPEEISELGKQVRKHLRLLVLFAATLFVGGLLFAWSGVYSVAATSGHYPFFRVFLGFALRQSVDTHTFGVEVPPLDDPAMI